MIQKFGLYFETFQGRHTATVISKGIKDTINLIPCLDNVRKNTMTTDAVANIKAAFPKAGQAGLTHS